MDGLGMWRGGRAVPAGEGRRGGRPAPAREGSGVVAGRCRQGRGRRGEGQRRRRHGEGAAWGRPAMGMEERADPFCSIRSDGTKVTAPGVGMEAGVFFFSWIQTTQSVFQRVVSVS